MAATIKIKNSSTASAVPTSSDLVQGELAVNVTDKRIFTENASGTVVELGTNPSTLTVTAGATIQGLTVGKGAGSVSTNTAVGVNALSSGSLSGGTNTAVGNTALQATTTGINNSGLGHAALVANTTGSENSAYGSTALVSNTTGSNNTAVGRAALYSNTTASNNTAVGYQAGYSNTTGQYATMLGWQAGYSTTTTSNGVYVGVQAGYSATGANNTFIGGGAGSSMTSGAKNTILGGYNGNQGGLNITTSSNYIVLSDGDGNPRGVFDSSGNLLVGATSDVNNGGFKFFPNYSRTGSSAVEMGHISGSASGEGFVGFKYNGGTIGSITQNGTTAIAYNTSSDYRLKENVHPMIGALNVVSQLKPCTYTWKADGSDGQGFIAHELAEVVPECVTGEKDAVDADGNPKYQGIDTSFLVATLTAAIQELKADLDATKAELAALKGQA